MQFGVLVTNHGKHSDEKLAVATAAQIIEIGATASGTDAIEGRKLELKIIDILEQHHKKVSHHEVGKLDSDRSHLASRLDPTEHVPSTFDQILAECLASPFKATFEREDVQRLLNDTLHSWTVTNMYMHRDWHAHGYTGHHTDLKPVENHDPDHEHVKTWKYKALKGGHGTGLHPALPKEAAHKG